MVDKELKSKWNKLKYLTLQKNEVENIILKDLLFKAIFPRAHF